MLEEKVLLLKSILNGKLKKRLYLYGAGKIGTDVVHSIRKYENLHNIKFIASFVDNRKAGEDKFICGLPVINKEQLQLRYNQQSDLVLITAADMSIVDDLNNIGITEYIICDGMFPDYCFSYERDRLAEKRPWEKAVQWMLDNIVDYGGIRAMSSLQHAYPEVTGYFIPTMMEYGYHQEAVQAAKWLMAYQSEDGGFRGTEGTVNEMREFAFDSGQILRGLLAVKDVPEIKEDARQSIEKTCKYLCGQMLNDGKGGYAVQYKSDGYIVEPIMIYTLPPLRQAAEWLGRDDWMSVADNCLNYYMEHPDFLKNGTLTHFLAYQMEALIELGKAEQINDTMTYLMQQEEEYGFIPGCAGASWTCTTGVAQIAKCCFLTGNYEFGEKILLELEKCQLATGGFWGSYGHGADYFPSVEISWAVKYFLDANRLHIKEWFNHHADHFSTDVDKVHHAELDVIKHILKPTDKKIADIGCGKGRFLKAIYEMDSDRQLYGADISAKMLAEVPDYVVKRLGSLEQIPFSDNEFDFVFCIEALEHSINPSVAIKELARITKRGGIILIIDKNITAWGRLKTPDWEQWFDMEKITQELRKFSTDVACQSLNMLGDAADDMFLAWIAHVK